jgi:hypothetical protein
MMIVIDDSRVISKLKTSLTDDARVIIYDRHMFIVQATDRLLDKAGIGAKDKHFSLSLKFKNYGQKSFIKLTPGLNLLSLSGPGLEPVIFSSLFFYHFTAEPERLTNQDP